jgi:hypothetical protein
MITRPVMFTSIDDAEVQKDRPVSEEVVRKLVQNNNLLGALAAIGSIRHVQINLSGAPIVNPAIWQLADGTEITNVDSPLKSVTPFTRNTPDCRQRYVCGAPDESTNATGGSPSVNLSHTHGTGNACSFGQPIDNNNDLGGYPQACHSHTVSNDLNSAEPLEPAHQELAIYLKIN